MYKKGEIYVQKGSFKCTKREKYIYKKGISNVQKGRNIYTKREFQMYKKGEIYIQKGSFKCTKRERILKLLINCINSEKFVKSDVDKLWII